MKNIFIFIVSMSIFCCHAMKIWHHGSPTDDSFLLNEQLMEAVTERAIGEKKVNKTVPPLVFIEFLESTRSSNSTFLMDFENKRVENEHKERIEKERMTAIILNLRGREQASKIVHIQLAGPAGVLLLTALAVTSLKEVDLPAIQGEKKNVDVVEHKELTLPSLSKERGFVHQHYKLLPKRERRDSRNKPYCIQQPRKR